MFIVTNKFKYILPNLISEKYKLWSVFLTVSRKSQVPARSKCTISNYRGVSIVCHDFGYIYQICF